MFYKQISIVIVCLVLAVSAQADYVVETQAAGGYNSRQVRTLVINRLAALGPKPDYAFLMVGTNDSLNSYNRVPVAEFETNVRDMLQRLINAGVEPFVAHIPPVIDTYVAARHPSLEKLPNLLVIDYNEAIGRAAAATSPTTTVVAVHERFFDHVNYGAGSWIRNVVNSGSADGVHPTIVGNSEIARAYSEMLPAPVSEPRRIVLFGDTITVCSNVSSPFKIADMLLEYLNFTAATQWRHYE